MNALKKMRSASQLIACACVLSGAAWARADGGAVIDRGRYGAYEATVFITPIAPSAGEIDLSMLLTRDGQPQLDVPVHVRADGPNGALSQTQMGESTTGNRLLRACALQLGSPGLWQVSIAIGQEKADGGTFQVTVHPPPPKWRVWLPWMVLWIPVVALIVVREILVARQRRNRGAWNETHHT